MPIHAMGKINDGLNFMYLLMILNIFFMSTIKPQLIFSTRKNQIMNKDTRISDVLHVLLHMEKVDTPLTSEILARSMGTNPAVFRRTMAGLRKAGLVHSSKGHGGGWRLAFPLHEISLFSVYEALDYPNLFAIGSRSAHSNCLLEQNVNNLLAATMSEAEELLAKRFREITLDEIVPQLG